MNNYFTTSGSVANTRFTILLSEVEVETPQGSLLRIVAFVSKSGIPESLETALTNYGVTIYEAYPFEGHAEIAVQNYRADTAAQQEDLGGPITKVNNAIMNNGAARPSARRG